MRETKVLGGRLQKPRQVWGEGTGHGRHSAPKSNVAQAPVAEGTDKAKAGKGRGALLPPGPTVSSGKVDSWPRKSCHLGLSLSGSGSSQAAGPPASL